MLTGTFEGTMGFVWICLPDGCYEVTVGGGEAPSEIGVFVAGAGWVWGNGSYFFCVSDYDAYADPDLHADGLERTDAVADRPADAVADRSAHAAAHFHAQLGAVDNAVSVAFAVDRADVGAVELWVMSVNAEIGLTGIGCATFSDARRRS